MKKEKEKKEVYKTGRTCCKAAKLKAHTCPYREDVHGDNESLCNCCEQCQHECAMDI